MALWLGQLLPQGGIFGTCFGRSGEVSTPEDPDEKERPLMPFFFFLTIFAMVKLFR